MALTSFEETTVDLEILTLKITRVKNVRVNFSRFRSIREIF